MVDRTGKNSTSSNLEYSSYKHEVANTLSIIGFVLPFAGFTLPGLIVSIIAYKKTKALGEKNYFAIAGIWIGSILTVLTLAYIVFVLALFFVHASFS